MCGRALIFALALLFSAYGAGLAQDATFPTPEAELGTQLKAGDPAPADGVFFTGPALIRLVESLRDKESWGREITALKHQVTALELALHNTHQESEERQKALEAMKLAVAKAEVILDNWERFTTSHAATMAKLDAYATKLEARIGSLEKQRNWALIANPIVGLIALIAGVFLGMP